MPTDDDPSDLRDLPEVSPEELPDIPRGDLTMDEFCSVWISEANPANLVNELFLPVGSAGDSEEMADEAVSLVQGQHERVLAFTGTVTQIAPDQIRGDVERWSDLETRSSAEYLSRWEDAVRFGGDNPRRSEMLDGDERAEWEDLYMTLNGACGLEPDQ